MPKIIPTDDEHFKQLTSNEEQYSLIQFSAVWCGPCKYITPHVENELNEWKEIQYIYIDIDEFEDLTEQYDVDGIPAFFLLKGTEVVDQYSGSDMNAILELLQKTKF